MRENTHYTNAHKYLSKIGGILCIYSENIKNRNRVNASKCKFNEHIVIVSHFLKSNKSIVFVKKNLAAVCGYFDTFKLLH